MRPFMGAGGAMAVEDAAILARCLASTTILPMPVVPMRRHEFRGSSDATHFDREQLVRWADRHRLVLLLRSVHGAAD